MVAFTSYYQDFMVPSTQNYPNSQKAVKWSNQYHLPIVISFDFRNDFEMNP